MKEINKSMLKDFYEQRYKEIIRQINRTEEDKKIEKIKEQIKKLIKENIIEKEILDTILSKIDLLDELFIGENIFYEEQFYKIGFVDGISFKSEIKQELRKYSKKDFKNNK